MGRKWIEFIKEILITKKFMPIDRAMSEIHKKWWTRLTARQLLGRNLDIIKQEVLS